MSDFYVVDEVFPIFLDDPYDDDDGYSVDVDFEVEIDSGDTDFPTTAEVTYRAFDSSTPNAIQLPVSGPASVDVDNEVKWSRWYSDSYTASVDTRLRANNPCFLYIRAADDSGDTPGSDGVEFDSPLLSPSIRKRAQCLPANHPRWKSSSASKEVALKSA